MGPKDPNSASQAFLPTELSSQPTNAVAAAVAAAFFCLFVFAYSRERIRYFFSNKIFLWSRMMISFFLLVLEYRIISV